MILVTGATGGLGSATIEHLLTKVGQDGVAALARDETKAAPLRAKGVDVRLGNYDDLPGLKRAMEGVSEVLLVSSSERDRVLDQHLNVIRAAETAGVGRVVYTGMAMKDAQASPMSPMFKALFATEDLLKDSGVAHTVLRNTLCTDALPVFLGADVFERGISLPAGDGRVPFALRREMGEAAANVLLQDDHEGKTYDLTASETYPFEDVARVLSRSAGRPVPYASPEPQAFEDALRSAGVPEPAAAFLSAFVADMREGRYDIIAPDFEELLGRKPASLNESLQEVYGP